MDGIVSNLLVLLVLPVRAYGMSKRERERERAFKSGEQHVLVLFIGIYKTYVPEKY